MWEGFGVQSTDRQLGFVEEVRTSSDAAKQSLMVVRAGRVVVMLVPLAAVDAVDPSKRLVFVSGDVARHAVDYLVPAA